jgi:chlorobactene glucosyltransferase
LIASLLYLSLAVLVVMLIITVYNILTAPQLRRAPLSKSTPLVSILVPARNEERNIAACLESFKAQVYANLEILVLDDGSTDNTAAMVNSFVEQDPRIRLIIGDPLPAGWLGKNWACDQLSRRARGEILLFIDADCRCAPSAVSHTVGWMQHLQAGMMSVFPQQLTLTLAEKLVVPVIYIFVYSLLPVWLVYRRRSPIFAAANGQWLAFTRDAYQRLGGHRAVRHQIVEDVELSRLAKRLGERLLIVCGTREVFCRMYDSARAVWEGFSKNAFGLVGFRSAPFFTLLAILTLTFVFPYFMLAKPSVADLAAVAVFMNVGLRLLLAWRYLQPAVVGSLLHPVAIAITMLIGLNSFRWFKTGRTKWKGRMTEKRG